MHSHDNGPTPEQLAESVRRGYETTDVTIKPLVTMIGVLISAVAIVAVIVVIIYNRILEPNAPDQNRPPMMAKSEDLINRELPLPQKEPIKDIRDYRFQEDLKLNSYYKQDGKYHIPVDVAMKIALKRGLPVQKQGEKPTGVTPTPEMQLSPKR